MQRLPRASRAAGSARRRSGLLGERDGADQGRAGCQTESDDAQRPGKLEENLYVLN